MNKKIVIGAVVAAAVAAVLVAGAFLAGRLPERFRRLAAEEQREALSKRAEEAEGRVRVCALLGQLQRVKDAVSAKNYGQAQDLSTRFFDEARAEAGGTANAEFKEALTAALGTRDELTAALARADPAAIADLDQVEQRLKGALGEPWSAAGVAVAAS